MFKKGQEVVLTKTGIETRTGRMAEMVGIVVEDQYSEWVRVKWDRIALNPICPKCHRELNVIWTEHRSFLRPFSTISVVKKIKVEAAA